MGDFELPQPSGLEAPADVIRYVEDTQNYLERDSREFTTEELVKLSDEMGLACKDIYMDSGVALAGIYKFFKPHETDPEMFEWTLEEGIVEGAAMGFVLRPISDFEPDPANSDDYKAELRLYERIRERAQGDYVICHVVNHTNRTAFTEDLGRFDIQRYQAIGPIMSSDLYVYGANEPGVAATRAENAEAVLSNLNGRNKKDLRAIEAVFDSGLTGLDALKACTPYAEGIANHNNQIVNNALTQLLCDRLSDSVRDMYAFGYVPNVYWTNADGNQQIASMTLESLRPYFLQGVSVQRKFYENPYTGQVHWPNRPELGLFAEFAVVDMPGIVINISVPVDLIPDGCYWKMEYEEDSASED